VLSRLLCALLFASAVPAAADEPPKKPAKASDEEQAFKARFNALVQKQGHAPIRILMAVNDDPSKLPETLGGSGPVLVANQRSGFYTPPILSSDDMSAVLHQHMVEIRKCYKQQLDADPEWSDEMILDIAVKKTGRVAELQIMPGRVKRDVIGKCLMSSVPKWKFPEFTGEIDEGIVQETVNASFPLSFSAK